MQVWVFVAENIEEFIPGLDLFRAYDALVDVGRQILHLRHMDIALWCSKTEARAARVILLDDEVIPVRCERMVMSTLSNTMHSTSGVLESEPVKDDSKILFGRALISNATRVPVRVTNVEKFSKTLSKGVILGEYQQEAWASNGQITSEYREKALNEQLQYLFADASRQVDATIQHRIRQLIIDYHDIFSVDGDAYGRTEGVYHLIDTGVAQPIRQTPRGLLLAKQGTVDEKVVEIKKKYH